MCAVLLQAMESKLLAGGKNIFDKTNEQERELEKQRQAMIDQKVRTSFCGEFPPSSPIPALHDVSVTASPSSEKGKGHAARAPGKGGDHHGDEGDLHLIPRRSRPQDKEAE